MKLLLSAIIFLTTLLSYAQGTQEWVLFRTVDGVAFYSKETDCTPENIPDQTGVLIKVVNTNNYSVVVKWDVRIWYDGMEQTANIKDEENTITQKIAKRSFVSGDCSTPNGNLYIFKKFITFSGSAVMTNFQFENITVEKTK
jgi:hypothetical protein